MFDEIFDGPSEPKRQSPFGYLTESEIEAKEAELHRQVMRRANCNLCDPDGYRGNLVCDHVNRTKTARDGIRKVRQAMSGIKLVNGIEP